MRNLGLNKYTEIIIIFFIISVTFSLYFQVHQFEFVGFDDNEYVYENPHVTSGINFENIRWALTAFHSNNWHPLTWISHMVDCRIFGLNPGWHHLVNLFFHISNSVLLFIIFRRMSGRLWQSAFVAAVFAVHPLHVESVAWVSERKDVLSTFFGLLTILSYAWYVGKQNFKRYSLVISFFILGLLSKPMLVTLPFVLLLLDYWPLRRFHFQKEAEGSRQNFFNIKHINIIEKIPLFVIAAASSIMTFFAQKAGAVMVSLAFIPIETRVANAITSYVSYIVRLFVPLNLSCIYPHPLVISWEKLLLSVTLLMIISAFAIKNIKKAPYFIVGWLWFLGTLVPVIGLVQVGMQSMADRYMYIPSIGLLLIISWGASEIIQKKKAAKKVSETVAIIGIILMVIISWKQIAYWENSEKLFKRALQVTDNNYIAHHKLGAYFSTQGREENAIKNYLKSIQIDPGFHDSYFNLGLLYYHQGEMEKAVSNLLKAAAIKPDYADTYSILGAAFFQKKDYEKAEENYLKEVKIAPDRIDANFNVGAVYLCLDKIDEAIAFFKKTIDLRPDFVNGYHYLGLSFDKKGQGEKALEYYQIALGIKPDSMKIRFLVAKKMMEQKKFAKAADQYSSILRLNPNNANAMHKKGVALSKLGDIDNAIKYYSKAIKLEPKFAEAYFDLGSALYIKGDVNGAISCFEQTLRIRPGFSKAKKRLEYVLKMKNL